MAKAYVYDMVDTWNAGATTFTAIKMNVTDTASAAGSLLMDLQVGGSSKFSVLKNGTLTVPFAQISPTSISGLELNYTRAGISLGSTAPVNWTDGQPGAGTMDLQLHRDAANTLAQRRSTNAQTFRVYNTYTDASNYERASVGWSASTFRIATEALGTGSPRQITLATSSSVAPIQFITNNTDRWNIAGAGHFLANTDNAYDIGASGASRPRDVYVAGTVIANSNIQSSSNLIAGAAFNVLWTGRSIINSPADGIIRLLNNAGTSFDRLQFGGTTSAYPSLKRNGAVLQIRLADDSSSADFTAAQITANASTAMPAGGAVTAGVRMSTTTNFGVFFGSGAPTLSAAKGSLYLRSDGTTTNDRMYVNTDGATTWTAVTTAA